jgi:NAD kinase
VQVHNRSDDVSLKVVQDGHTMGDVPPGGCMTVGMGERRARLARLTGTSFFSRYRETFTA